MSPRAFSNMSKLLEKMSVDHIVFRPRSDLAKLLFLRSESDIYPESLLKVGSAICISCIRTVTNLSLRTAIEKGIPIVMLGNSPGQIIRSESEVLYKDNRIPYEMKKKLFSRLAEAIGDDIYYYVMLSEEEYRASPFPYTISPFSLVGYDEETIYKTITELGWKKPADVDPNSTNCRLNSLGIVRHKESLGFHPYDYEMSKLVRLGQISREEALRRVEDREGKVEALATAIRKMLDT